MNTELTEKKKFIDHIKSNFKLIASILTVLILILVYFIGSNYFDKEKRVKISEDFIKAKILIESKNNNEALELLINIIHKKDAFYSPLSLFIIIDKSLEKNHNNIVSYFDQVILSKNLSEEDLNLIKFKKAIFISEKSKEREILDLLDPILDSDSLWKADVIKFLGDYYFSSQQYKKAFNYYKMLLSNDFSNVDTNEINKKIQIIENE